jgi:hypothetical protein
MKKNKNTVPVKEPKMILYAGEEEKNERSETSSEKEEYCFECGDRLPSNRSKLGVCSACFGNRR